MPAKKQRVVILPGPHKTGTTSVQSFLASLTKNKLLGDWEWPASSSKAFSDVAHSIFFDSNDKNGILRRKREKLQSAWKKGHSIVFGAELFDYIAAMPVEELPGAFERLQSVLPPDVKDVTVAVMYRTPRSSHLISAWKQQIAMAKRSRRGGHVWRVPLGGNKTDAPSLAKWLCTGRWEGRMEFHVKKILAAQLSPMGIASAFLRHDNMSVIMGDMSNMPDISNTIACEVLKVPCTDQGKVLGFNKTAKVRNQRSNPVELGLNPEQLKEVEEVLRKMDCFYYCDLRDNLDVLHANDTMFTNKDGWNDCCASPETFLSPSQAYDKLKMIGCRASGSYLPVHETATQPSLKHADFVDMKAAFGAGEESMRFPLFMLAFNMCVALALLLRFQKKRRNK